MYTFVKERKSSLGFGAARRSLGVNGIFSSSNWISFSSNIPRERIRYRYGRLRSSQAMGNLSSIGR
jgi:hypothetical protein